jgi:hypothetical protein
MEGSETRRVLDSQRGDGGRVLACAGCGQPITTFAARIEVDGAHEHHFTNPDGYAFHIGCFSSVSGCRAVGQPDKGFSWFPGTSWQVELCTGCSVQLGWLYRGGERRFHGLILSQLVERDANT